MFVFIGLPCPLLALHFCVAVTSSPCAFLVFILSICIIIGCVLFCGWVLFHRASFVPVSTDLFAGTPWFTVYHAQSCSVTLPTNVACVYMRVWLILASCPGRLVVAFSVCKSILAGLLLIDWVMYPLLSGKPITRRNPTKSENATTLKPNQHSPTPSHPTSKQPKLTPWKT